MTGKMQDDLNLYLSRSIDRYGIKNIGYHTAACMPFAILDDDSIFYGMPTKKEGVIENLVVGIVDVVKELEYRYFQTNRKLKQHSRYNYKPGDVVVEIGAYIGYYSIYAAKQVGPTGKDISVEMVPDNYTVLELNLLTNSPHNTIAVNRGIYREKGTRTAFMAGKQIAGFRKDVIEQYSNNHQELQVEMDTVDNILRENDVDKVDLMIIQINGNEIHALHGMSTSIHVVQNFAIAVPYERARMDNKALIVDYLESHDFQVENLHPWMFASRER